MTASIAIRNFIDAMLHPSARADAMTSVRHRVFIAPRLLGSLAVLALLPFYLTLRGSPTVAELMVVIWLVVPVLLAYFLSRTGRYESAHMLSSLAMTGLIVAVAIKTGGIESFAGCGSLLCRSKPHSRPHGAWLVRQPYLRLAALSG